MRVHILVTLLVMSAAQLLFSSCSAGAGREVAALPASGARVVIFAAKAVVTMRREGDVQEAVAVRDGRVLAVGSLRTLQSSYPEARTDRSFVDQVLIPGLIDPHIHVVLGGLLYAQPFAPPWPMASLDGMTEGYPSPEAFQSRVRELVASAPKDDSPVVVYGYHNLIQGVLDRKVLDSIAPSRPLIVWHYSGHDFYLNSVALAQIGATPAMASKFHGIDLAADGDLTGRIYEDAAFLVLERMGSVLLSSEAVARGTSRYFGILSRAGVTTAADLAYGVFGRALEDRMIASTWSQQKNGFRLYLVPEYRAFEREFGSPTAAAAKVNELVEGNMPAAAPVLPRVKFFTDGAFYSQTMRLKPPGYLSGQSAGTEGLWVVPPDRIAEVIRPYMQAGLGAHIHSNGDAAQDATLNGLGRLRAEGLNNAFVVEHGGLFSPDQAQRAAELNAMLSVASHYAFYMAHRYAEPLGPGRAGWITPVGALSRAGAVVALHSDAPLAPPMPLRAAGAHITRDTLQGATYEPDNAFKPYDALEAVTLDAARVLGLETEIGSIEAGKRADFTVLQHNPLTLPGKDWQNIDVKGTVLGGEVRLH